MRVRPLHNDFLESCPAVMQGSFCVGRIEGYLLTILFSVFQNFTFAKCKDLFQLSALIFSFIVSISPLTNISRETLKTELIKGKLLGLDSFYYSPSLKSIDEIQIFCQLNHLEKDLRLFDIFLSDFQFP